MPNPTRRQFMAWGGAAALIGATRGQVRGQGVKDLRIGIVVPSKTSGLAVATSINDFIGDGARHGAILAESRVGERASERGWDLKLLHANAPSADAAVRAGQRLVATTDISALVGGVGEGQAEVLSAIAEEAQIPFFNVGSMRDALRQADCSRYTFHVEASDAMYLDAMIAWTAAQGRRRLFVMYENSERGRALHARALQAIDRHGADGQVVGSAPVAVVQPDYYDELYAARDAEADVILVLVNAIDQMVILGQAEAVTPDAPIMTFPEPVTQTRDYIATAQTMIPLTNPRQRVALWETTHDPDPDFAFNEPYITRWGLPADPTAWSAYAAMKILFDAVDATGSTQSADIVSYLVSPDVTFDVGKGTGLSFRPWDHQLRQPLYVIDVDQQVEWVRMDTSTWIALGSLAAEVPAANPALDTEARLDQLGDGPDGARCTF